MTDGQKYPAVHEFKRSAVLPVARQEPTVHAMQTSAPLLLYVPEGHKIPAVDAVGQYEPAGHNVPDVAPTVAQNVPAVQGFDKVDLLAVAVQ